MCKQVIAFLTKPHSHETPSPGNLHWAPSTLRVTKTLIQCSAHSLREKSKLLGERRYKQRRPGYVAVQEFCVNSRVVLSEGQTEQVIQHRMSLTMNRKDVQDHFAAQ